VVYGLAAGGSHACGIFNTDGLVYCWGDNDHGQLGTGDNVSLARPEVAVDLGGKKAVSVAAGFEHTCAITDDGLVYCWGASGEYGALGNGSVLTDSNVPVLADNTRISYTGEAVAKVYAGFDTSCATTVARKELFCWGNNDDGQYGGAWNADYSESVPVPTEQYDVDDMAIGVGHSCLIILGEARCSGVGADGQLGDGRFDDSYAPVEVSGIAGEVSAVSAGYFMSCGMTVDGKFYCWGDNTSGQLGDGASGVPVQLADYGAAVPIASGYAHNCAGFYCIGENGSGQLGDGSMVSKSVMTAVDVGGVLAGLSVKDVAAGFDFTCWVAGNADNALEDAAFCAGSLAGSDVPVAVDTSEIAREETYIKLNVDTDDVKLTVKLTVVPNGGVAAKPVNLTVVTNNLTGYDLSVKADDANLKCGSYAMPAQSANGAALEVNHWGYGVGAAEPTAWNGATTSDAVIANSLQATTESGAAVKAWFGAKADFSMPACAGYSGETTFTAEIAI
jgi:alpha-tubulin suppressor-like RCC1 family protein